MQLSDRVQAIKPSPTIAVSTRAAELRAAGQDVIGLGSGEPDFDTPGHIKAAAKKALDDNFTRYTAVDGILSLKEAIVRKLKRDNELSYEPGQIVVSTGAKHSIYNLMQASLNPGDEVLIPAPYWVSYPDMAILTGATPVFVSAGIEAGFKITPEQLDAAISDKTRMLILNSPSNPTGICYTREDMQGLGEVLKKYPQVLICSDDIYEHIVWGPEPFCNIVTACPELYEQTVVINGLSKAYCMTGWRMGYVAGPSNLATAMRKIQSQSTSNPTSISQIGAQVALDGEHEFMKPMIKAFHERHDLVLRGLNNLTGVRCLEAQGAFYAFPDMREAIAGLNSVEDDVALAEHLLNEGGVAIVPGSAFGAPGYARLSFATNNATLEDALSRMGRVLGTDQ
jgi:aspartate aminotransferase